ncbi:MAG: hypothetical protein OXU79_15200 [Gemmatimonadota bacterium]|nr:hypothetical protein [Gemmatimonadota bacterium]
MLRIHGTPDDIDTYAYAGFKVWRYGRSTVRISITSRRVTEWDNVGNLHVRLDPGTNTTRATNFTLGSHEDDVLRIQGTPDDIDTYAYAGFKVWRYGRSTVRISITSRRVTEWDNAGNLRARLDPNGTLRQP